MDKDSEVLNVVVLAYEGVDELDLFGAWSVLKKAEEVVPLPSESSVRVRLAGPSGSVIGSAGTSFTVPFELDVLVGATAIVVPGGKGARQAADSDAIRGALSDAIDLGARVYGICTGALIIASTGKASGSCLAIHRNKREALLDFPVNDVRTGLVHDGPFLTVGGDDAPSVKSVDLGLAVLRDIAPYAMDPVRARMEISGGRDVVTVVKPLVAAL
ncbi:DJ-1/PfpI family protein [Paraburkholderia xenovorans]|uniref:DJ-1/PfpI family protein n=1 Tax=Paraburkholderia xenovorans TaxID=36873 RepID=UPI0038BDDCB8